MHYPYLALVWDDTEPARAAAAAQLIDSFRRSHPSWITRPLGPGAVSLDAGVPGHVAVYQFASRSGILYGRLFRRDTSRPLPVSSVEIDDAFARACVSSNGGCLTENYWGAYIAIMAAPNARAWVVLRDCSGMMPCFYMTASGVTLFFSDVACLDGMAIPLCIDWSYVIGFLAQPQLEVRNTGLRGMRELLAGEAVSVVRDEVSTYFAWNPASVCASDPIIDEDEACVAIRETTQSCVNAWATTFSRVLHSLSGGFDSTVVLGSLLRAPARPEVLCVNRFACGAAEDERRFARAAARFYGVELVEVPWDTGTLELNEQCLGAPAAPKPMVPHLIGFLEAPFWNEICTARALEAIWTGQGGDHLFMSAKVSHGIVDCLRLHGCRKHLTSAIWDAAVLTGQSIWHVMASAAATALDRRRFERQARLPIGSQFLRPEALPPQLEHYVAHPWWLASSTLPPGKRFQILLLADVLNRHRPIPGIQHTEELHPLLSQPLLEACLQIPLHLLLQGGKTRGLARRAFSSYLPAEISSRECKGQTSTYILSLLRRSNGFLTELLLDGELVRSGVVSRDALAPVLTRDEPIRAESVFPLLACVTAEVWARGWNRRAAGASGLSASIVSEEQAVNDTGTRLEGVPTNPASSKHLRIPLAGRAD